MRSTNPPAIAPLRIVVITPEWVDASVDDGHAQDQGDRSRSLRIGLLESGFHLVASLPADVFLTERLAQLQPDMIIVDAESEARDALEHVVMATRAARRPIVMFTNDHDTANARAAVAAGAGGCTVAIYPVPGPTTFSSRTCISTGAPSRG